MASQTTTLFDAVLGAISQQPRTILEEWPTPLLPMNGLRRALLAEGIKCPNLWIKREDMTSYGLGGDKIRRLEFFLGKYYESSSDVLITGGGIHSNMIIQAAAVAARLGIECEVFVQNDSSEGPLSEGMEGINAMFCLLHGARVHFTGPLESFELAMQNRADELTAEGRRPYLLRLSGTEGSTHSTLGSLLCLHEMVEQAKVKGFTPSGIVAPTRWSGNSAGFLVGASLMEASGGPTVPLYIIDTFGRESRVPARKRIMNVVESCWKMLRLPGKCNEELLRLSTDFAGAGKSRTDPRTAEAMRLAGCNEGIVLDSSYTGKSMAGLLHFIRNKQFSPDDNIIYFHCGGMPALFAMRRILLRSEP
jgi:1-aminocyclopropane-1-carboxylate deaminase/D-cysteine desulfhydrase-like pyridoxal-dependent ACC family enzyme